jgi:hypothetical protein
VPDHASGIGATKSATNLLVVFIPSTDRDGQSIEQDGLVTEALNVLGTNFGGATAFPQGRGVWRDDARGGHLVYDEPVVIQCYTAESLIETQSPALREFLIRVGTETDQGAVGLVIDRDYLEISFPLKDGS